MSEITFKEKFKNFILNYKNYMKLNILFIILLIIYYICDIAKYFIFVDFFFHYLSYFIIVIYSLYIMFWNIFLKEKLVLKPKFEAIPKSNYPILEIIFLPKFLMIGLFFEKRTPLFLIINMIFSLLVVYINYFSLKFNNKRFDNKFIKIISYIMCFSQIILQFLQFYCIHNNYLSKYF